MEEQGKLSHLSYREKIDEKITEVKKLSDSESYFENSEQEKVHLLA